MHADILHTTPGAKELVERAAIGLVTLHPELFAVNQPLNNDCLVSLTVRTNLVFDDGILQLSISLDRYKKSGEFTQRISIANPDKTTIYRLDVSSGPEIDEEKEQLSSIVEERKNMAEAITAMLNDSYDTSQKYTIRRSDNYAETDITTDSARRLIETGGLQLPSDTRMTLYELKQKLGTMFPLLGNVI
jgi:hypothetical protein